jgi:hypothetical protein
MAINRFWALGWVLLAGAAWSRETAPVSDCQSAAGKPSIVAAKAAVERTPGDLRAQYGLADAWSDAGCYSDAVQVLQAAQAAHPGNKELATRLRVARSLIGEEHYFDTLDRADAEAKLKRDTFRCSTLSDLEACAEAVRLKPDDAALLTAQADALMHAKRPAEESVAAGHLAAAEKAAGSLAANSSAQDRRRKPIRVARLESTPAATAPARRYSNVPQDDRSH